MCDRTYLCDDTKFISPESVVKQLRTSYDGHWEKVAVQTAQDGIPRRVARFDELMALRHRSTIDYVLHKCL